MDFFTALKISSSALSVERARLDIIASNLSNVNTTRTPEGGPYKKREIIIAAVPLELNFGDIFDEKLNKLRQVKVIEVVEDQREPLMIYNPAHPDANALGYVAMPNINIIEEMVNLISATRAYEANITTINAAKGMALKAIEIGR